MTEGVSEGKETDGRSGYSRNAVLRRFDTIHEPLSFLNIIYHPFEDTPSMKTRLPTSF